jgi:hypothetical protein
LHTSTSPDAWCSENHKGNQGWRRPAASEHRQWRVTGDTPVVDGRHRRANRALEPGTELRLDAIHIERASYGEDGPQPWGFPGDYDEVYRRFCVFEGRMAGTCWEAVEVMGVGARLPAYRDRVERVE